MFSHVYVVICLSAPFVSLKQHFNTSKQPIKQVSFRAFRVACHPSFGSRVMEEIPVDLEPYDVQAARVEEQWEVRGWGDIFTAETGS